MSQTSVSWLQIYIFSLKPLKILIFLIIAAGKVTLLEPLDYELVPGYNLTILASDQGQLDQQRTSHNVTVRVIDEYDLVPQCEPKVTEMTIKSSVPVSTEIAQVHAGKGNLSYTLTGRQQKSYCKIKKNLDTRKKCCNYPKIEHCGLKIE